MTQKSPVNMVKTIYTAYDIPLNRIAFVLTLARLRKIRIKELITEIIDAYWLEKAPEAKDKDFMKLFRTNLKKTEERHDRIYQGRLERDSTAYPVTQGMYSPKPRDRKK